MAREVADPADQWQRQVRYIEAELDLLNGLPVDADLNVVRFLVAPNSQDVRPRRLLWEELAEFREQHLRISRRETKNGLIESCARLIRTAVTPATRAADAGMRSMTNCHTAIVKT